MYKFTRYLYIYTYIHIYIYIYIHTCVCVCVFVYVYGSCMRVQNLPVEHPEVECSYRITREGESSEPGPNAS